MEADEIQFFWSAMARSLRETVAKSVTSLFELIVDLSNDPRIVVHQRAHQAAAWGVWDFVRVLIEPPGWHRLPDYSHASGDNERWPQSFYGQPQRYSVLQWFKPGLVGIDETEIKAIANGVGFTGYRAAETPERLANLASEVIKELKQYGDSEKAPAILVEYYANMPDIEDFSAISEAVEAELPSRAQLVFAVPRSATMSPDGCRCAFSITIFRMTQIDRDAVPNEELLAALIALDI